MGPPATAGRSRRPRVSAAAESESSEPSLGPLSMSSQAPGTAFARGLCRRRAARGTGDAGQQVARKAPDAGFEEEEVLTADVGVIPAEALPLGGHALLDQDPLEIAQSGVLRRGGD